MDAFLTMTAFHNWTSAAAAETVLHWYEQHVPNGTLGGTVGTTGTTGSGGGVSSYSFDVQVPVSAADAAALGDISVTVGIAVTPTGSRISAVAKGNVRPTRPATSLVPDSVTGMTVHYSQLNSKTRVDKTFPARAARAVARAVDSLPAGTGALHGCPMIAATLTLDFVSGVHHQTVTDSLCQSVVVSTAPQLSLSGSVVDVLEQQTGLKFPSS